MKQMKEELWIKKSDTQDLISKFLSQLDLTSRSRGHLKIEISKFENEKSSIKVALKSVSKLEPRPKKSSLDFSLSLSIQPKNLHGDITGSSCDKLCNAKSELLNAEVLTHSL